MSNSIVHSILSKTVCKVLQHIGADIWEEKIESCHCNNKEIDHTIVKFLGDCVGDGAQEVFKRFKSNRFRSSRRDTAIHR